MTVQVSMNVNGVSRSADVEARTSLGDFLRDSCGLTGTHLGCEHGVCGACTVIADDAPIRSCITYAVQLEQQRIQTIEGLIDDPIMVNLRRAFFAHHALQCGFCTAGMLITGRDIIKRLGAVDEATIRQELAGNLCRCTGYVGIVRAIAEVARAFPGTAREPVLAPSGAASRPSPTFADTTRSKESPARATDPPAAASPLEVTAASDGFSIEHSFSTPFGLQRVWSFFGDPEAVAACLPGAALTGRSGEHLEWRIQIKFGPIKAAFIGAATYSRDDATKTGMLVGGGRDSLSNSRASGKLRFALMPVADDETQVDVTFSFSLQGLLAQFSRPALVRDFTGFMIEQFATNVSSRLRGETSAPAAVNRMSGIAFLRWWLRRLWRR
ncbi:MAG TPA: 2Fe-2S iron-sulfur cluster-binding protein [Steroidobacteraceae bacterium]